MASRRCFALVSCVVAAAALSPPPPPRRTRAAPRHATFDDEQWALYASQSGRWEGVWTTFDDQGLEQMAHTGVWDVQLVPEDRATHALEVPGPGGGARTIPVGTYQKGALGRQTCAGAGMVCGPSLLRSGLMSTELLLRHGASRLRVTVQHAPAEGKEEGVEPALLCYRCVVARERCDAQLGAPTREVEASRWGDGQETPADGDDTHFWRGQSPWAWRRTWRGESAVAIGGEIQRFQLDDGLVEAGDDWHESTRAGEASYNLALPGAIRVYAPQVVPAGAAVPLRVAWMPNAKALLRADATMVALEEDEPMSGRYLPPRLVTFRADELVDVGPKAGDPVYVDPPEGK